MAPEVTIDKEALLELAENLRDCSEKISGLKLPTLTGEATEALPQAQIGVASTAAGVRLDVLLHELSGRLLAFSANTLSTAMSLTDTDHTNSRNIVHTGLRW
ncbi:MAG: hypothetical protein ACRCSF_10630 [Mycobacteriaceae bacterium]